MGVPTSEVGYTTAMPTREDHEVYKDMWWHWIKKTIEKRWRLFEQSEISRKRVGYYAISGTVIKIQVTVTGRISSELILFLLRNYLQHEVSRKRKYRLIAEETLINITLTSASSSLQLSRPTLRHHLDYIWWLSN
jgi:hypothetical protein